MTIALSELSHINAIVGDADIAVQLLQAVFGAPCLEGATSSTYQQESERTLRVGLGDVALQIFQPFPESGELRRLLTEQGPQVHSLAFFVDDLESAEAELALEGIHCFGRSTIPLKNSRLAPVCLLDTMDWIGFNLELIEGDVGRSSVAGARNRPEGALFGNLSPLLHVELAVDDLGPPCELLCRVFGSAKVETGFAEFLSSLGSLDIVHVNLGNVVLQYCRPKTNDSPWAQLLARRGRAIHNLTWLVRDMPETVLALARQGVTDLRSFSLDFGTLVGNDHVPENLAPQRIVDLMPILGFHMELTEEFSTNIDDYLFNPLSGWKALPHI